LVREFLRAGAATYYSDEFAVFDRNGYVHSFSGLWEFRVDGSDAQTLKFASEFGSAIGRSTAAGRLVILTTYKKEASSASTSGLTGRGNSQVARQTRFGDSESIAGT